MDQTEFGMPSREYYLKERNDTTILAYETMLVDLALALGADKGTAQQDAKAIVDLERDLAKVKTHFPHHTTQYYILYSLTALHPSFSVFEG